MCVCVWESVMDVTEYDCRIYLLSSRDTFFSSDHIVVYDAVLNGIKISPGATAAG